MFFCDCKHDSQVRKVYGTASHGILQKIHPKKSFNKVSFAPILKYSGGNPQLLGFFAFYLFFDVIMTF